MPLSERYAEWHRADYLHDGPARNIAGVVTAVN